MSYFSDLEDDDFALASRSSKPIHDQSVRDRNQPLPARPRDDAFALALSSSRSQRPKTHPFPSAGLPPRSQPPRHRHVPMDAEAGARPAPAGLLPALPGGDDAFLPPSFKHPDTWPESPAPLPPANRSTPSSTLILSRTTAEALPSPGSVPQPAPPSAGLHVWDRIQKSGKEWLQGAGIITPAAPLTPQPNPALDSGRQRARETQQLFDEARKHYEHWVEETETLLPKRRFEFLDQIAGLASRRARTPGEDAQLQAARQEEARLGAALRDAYAARRAAYQQVHQAGREAGRARAALADAAQKELRLSPALARAYVERETGHRFHAPTTYRRHHDQRLDGRALLDLARRGDEIVQQPGQTPEQVAADLEKHRLSLPGLRGQVNEGKISAEEGRDLQQHFHGVQPVTPGQYWPSEQGLQGWLHENGKLAEYQRAHAGLQDVDKVRELRDAYVDHLASRYSSAVDFDWEQFEPVREKFVESEVGGVSATANFAARAAKDITASSAGMASQVGSWSLEAIGGLNGISATVNALTGNPGSPFTLSGEEKSLIAQRSAEWYRNAKRNWDRLTGSEHATGFNQALDKLQAALRENASDEDTQAAARELAGHAAALFRDESGLDTPDQFDVTAEPQLLELAEAYRATRNPKFWQELRTRLATSVNGRKIKDALQIYITDHGQRSPDSWKATFLNARVSGVQELLSEVVLTWATAGALKAFKAARAAARGPVSSLGRLAGRIPGAPLVAGGLSRGAAATRRLGQKAGQAVSQGWEKLGIIAKDNLTRWERAWNALARGLKRSATGGLDEAAEETLVAAGEEDLTADGLLATAGSTILTSPFGAINRAPTHLARWLRDRFQSRKTSGASTPGNPNTEATPPDGPNSQPQPPGAPHTPQAGFDPSAPNPATTGAPTTGSTGGAASGGHSSYFDASLPAPGRDRTSTASPRIHPPAGTRAQLPPKERAALDLLQNGATIQEAAAATGLSPQGAFFAASMGHGKTIRAQAQAQAQAQAARPPAPSQPGPGSPAPTHDSQGPAPLSLADALKDPARSRRHKLLTGAHRAAQGLPLTRGEQQALIKSRTPDGKPYAREVRTPNGKKSVQLTDAGRDLVDPPDNDVTSVSASLPVGRKSGKTLTPTQRKQAKSLIQKVLIADKTKRSIDALGARTRKGRTPRGMEVEAHPDGSATLWINEDALAEQIALQPAQRKSSRAPRR